MGNYRFRLSDMIPNAWFYKLKDMGNTRNHNTIHPPKKKQPPTSSSSAAAAQPSKPKQPHLSHQRKSYYFTRDLIPSPPNIDPEAFYSNNSPRSIKASDTHFPDPPRKSSNKRRSTRRNRTSNRQFPRLVTSTVSAGCSCHATIQSVWTKPDSTSEEYPNSPLDSSSDLESLLPECGSDRGGLTADSFDGMVSWSSSCHCRLNNDIIIDMDDKSLDRKLDGFDTIGEVKVELPPIITNKPAKFNDAIKEMKKKKKKEEENIESKSFTRSSAKFEERNANGSLFVKVVKDTISTSKEQRTSPVRRFSVNSPGLKLRTNSPRIASRKLQTHSRKSVSSTTSSGSRRSLSETFAVVKSSRDPQRDFRESMVEMILENNIRASKELEELLACYLSLNSDEYHDVIIKAFKQIWFDLTEKGLK